MFSALCKAIEQTFDPVFRRVFIISLLLSCGLLGLLLVVISSVVTWWLPDWAFAWLPDWVLDWGVGLGLFWAWTGGLFLFPAVMVAVLSFFLEDIARAVERKHYPDRPAARSQPLTEVCGGAVQFLGLTLGVNLLVLPFYLVAFFIPGLSFVLYYIVNGYLFGREYAMLVSGRRSGWAELKRICPAGAVFWTGVLGAFLFTLPVLNLIAPLWMTAVMVHRYEDWQKRVAQ